LFGLFHEGLGYSRLKIGAGTKKQEIFIVLILVDFDMHLSVYKNLAFHNTGRYIINVRGAYEQKS